MRLLNEELKKKLPAMMNEYKREQRGDSRLDDSRDLDARIRQMLQEVSAALEKRIAQFGLDSKIQRIAKMTQNTSVREWKRAVKDTLGIDILDDYYSGELYEQAVQRHRRERGLHQEPADRDARQYAANHSGWLLERATDP